MKRVAYIIALLLVLTGGAIAQSPSDGIGSGDVQLGFSASGVETSRGTFDTIDNKFWGNTFALNGSNRSETYHLTISMDHVQNSSGVDSSSITSGGWTLTVYKNGVYSGAIYGDITAGSITWKSDRAGNIFSRYTTGKLRVTGGRGSFEGIGENLDGSFDFTSEVGPASPQAQASIRIGL